MNAWQKPRRITNVRGLPRQMTENQGLHKVGIVDAEGPSLQVPLVTEQAA